MQKNRMIKYGLVVVLFLLCGFLYSCGEQSPALELEAAAEAEESPDMVDAAYEEEQQGIMVYVCGEVAVPGVYELPADARMYQAVEAAGGVLPGAAPNYLNLAEGLKDGQKIDVPTIEQAAEMEAVQEQDTGRLVNINTAGEELLTTLPGIGASKAKSIMAAREARGGFRSIEELMEIEGIKEGVYNKIKDLITID